MKSETAEISAADPYPRRRLPVLDSEVAFIDVGSGPPIIFLHGNPTSSYLWRNVIPHVESLGRCLAPDLIGMGDSGKNPAGSYRFEDHNALLRCLAGRARPVGRVAFVGHDWGGALAFDWACRNPDRVESLVYMETIVRPLAWDEWPDPARPLFRAMRSPAGEEIVLNKNVFIERILPGSVLRPLTTAEMDVYRRPYREPGESRRPCCPGRGRSPSTASPPTWRPSWPATPAGSAPRRCRSSSSTPSPA